MKAFLENMKKSCYLQALCTIALGIVFLVFPNGSADFICRALGVLLIVSAVLEVFSYVAFRESAFFSGGLVLGIVMAVIGVWMLARPAVFVSLFQIVLGVFLVAHGAMEVTQAMTLRRAGYSNWMVVLGIGIVTAILGILVLLDPFATAAALMILIGVSLVLDGIAAVWVASRINRFSKQVEKEAPIDLADDQWQEMK